MYGIHVHALCIISFASCPRLPFLWRCPLPDNFFHSLLVLSPIHLPSRLQFTSFCLFITSLLVFLDSLSNLFYLLAIYIVNGKPANLEHSYDRKISKCTEYKRISNTWSMQSSFCFFSSITNKSILLQQVLLACKYKTNINVNIKRTKQQILFSIFIF